MAGHEAVVNAQTTEKRHLHPVRKIVRVVSRTRSRPKDQLLGEEHTCRGPSFSHNLLPILEPFFALNPKLLFIEDHILGRKRNTSTGQSLNLPSDPKDSKTQVEKIATPCNCDICAPHLYQLRSPTSHGTIHYQPSLPKHPKRQFTHSHHHGTLPTPLPSLTLKPYGHYEAMRLVRHHTAWLHSTYLSLPPSSPLPPSAQALQTLLSHWRPHLSGADLRDSLAIAQLTTLFTHLNRVFFFGAIPPHRPAVSNGFAYLPVSEEGSYGVAVFSWGCGTQVLLHPVLYRGMKKRREYNTYSENSESGTSFENEKDEKEEEGERDEEKRRDLDVRFRNRLGTLLHELSHAFLKAYVCRSCPMHEATIGVQGHGRAWQVLAEKVEQVAARVVGGYVDLGRGVGMGC